MPHLIQGKLKDLGDGFQVLRILPHVDARSIGPFVFVDHFGPAEVRTGHELTVRPHPHIGLSTITYLYDGVLAHRDSLGNEQFIGPGAVNWMTAGRGIVHSERSVKGLTPATMEGIQTWVALPAEHEETDPAFEHYEAGVLPVLHGEKWQLRLIAGSLMGQTSPVKTQSSLFYADLQTAGATVFDLTLPPGEEAALYVARGSFTALGHTAQVGAMLVLTGETRVQLSCHSAARAVLLGGKKFPEPRHLWWNFVSTSKERIERAKAEWQANTMGIVAGETDRIPLPAGG